VVDVSNPPIFRYFGVWAEVGSLEETNDPDDFLPVLFSAKSLHKKLSKRERVASFLIHILEQWWSQPEQKNTFLPKSFWPVTILIRLNRRYSPNSKRDSFLPAELYLIF
jgi:hypothetical protein